MQTNSHVASQRASFRDEAMKTRHVRIALWAPFWIVMSGCDRPVAQPGYSAGLDHTPWSAWSGALRMRIAPTKPMFGPHDPPSFAVEFEASRPLDVNIPHLLPKDADSVIGPFTTLEVWVRNRDTGARYLDSLNRISTGKAYALVPAGSSLERVGPGQRSSATLVLKGPFLPAEAVEVLREAHKTGACIEMPKSIDRLPPGKYAMSVDVRPSSVEGRPAYIRAAVENPPGEYRNVWTGTLRLEDVRFEISQAATTRSRYWSATTGYGGGRQTHTRRARK